MISPILAARTAEGECKVEGGYAPPFVLVVERCYSMRGYMRLPAAIRTRSDGEWHKGEHYSHLEFGQAVMNSLTKVGKDTLVIEIYEQTRHTESKIQRARWHSGIVPQRKVEQCGGVAMPLPTGDTDKHDHGTSPKDNNDICT